MSKYVGCIINELDESELIGSDFELFVISLAIDDTGEIISTEFVEPIGKIAFDIESVELNDIDLSVPGEHFSSVVQAGQEYI